MKYKIIDENMNEEMFTPAYESDAGVDLRASLKENICINPSKSNADAVMIPTGIVAAVPEGYVMLLIPKSGLSTKKGMVLANTVGVIDSGYRGEIQVPLLNNGNTFVVIEPLDKLCQMVLVPHYDMTQMEAVEDLSETERGEGGFGSSDPE